MKVIFCAPKINVPKDLLKDLEKRAEVVFFEDDPIDVRKIGLLKQKGDKILCPFPEPMAWKFPSEFIREIPDLKAICLSTTSFSWIDGKLARSLGVDLTNVPNPPNGVAEGLIFAMLGVAKKYAVTFKEKKIEFKPANYFQELKDKTMGIIGLGRIGSRVAELGEAMGMEVIYWSRKTRNKAYGYRELPQLVREADYIFPTMVANEETKGSVSKKLLDAMKPSAAVIATLNGELVDMACLLKKVANGELYGRAIESKETNINDYKGNVFVTYGNSWYTKETVEQKMKIWIANIIGVINGKPINLVN